MGHLVASIQDWPSVRPAFPQRVQKPSKASIIEMSSILDELRRRAQGQEAPELSTPLVHEARESRSQSELSPTYSETPAVVSATAERVASGSQIAGSVAEIFEHTRVFAPRFRELKDAIELIERL